MSAEIYDYDALAKKPPTLQSTQDVQPSSSTLKQPSLLSWLFGQKRTKTVTIPKTVGSRPDPMSIDLASLLQYSSAEGHPALKAFIRDFVEKVYQPGFADWQIQLTVGATAAWNQIVFTFIERGDAILVVSFHRASSGKDNRDIDEASVLYRRNGLILVQPTPTSLWTLRWLGTYLTDHQSSRIVLNLPPVFAVIRIPIDGEGIVPEEMEKILANWDEEKEGRKRPRILYTVPTGQNPTGATMLGERKKAIYEIAVKYDIIICEDEVCPMLPSLYPLVGVPLETSAKILSHPLVPLIASLITSSTPTLGCPKATRNRGTHSERTITSRTTRKEWKNS